MTFLKKIKHLKKQWCISCISELEFLLLSKVTVCISCDILSYITGKDICNVSVTVYIHCVLSLQMKYH